ncbi:acyl-CoA thioesterase [Sagittula sp. NFXS13]|uniref:Acyl-CoA thioester hydrolase n=1 Tax=Sagittula marina TaxID=943940 RepID=A0A7W6GQX8_9RHOB|nr:acyl-CoA thioester hydrolase [Sagittula marina]
MSRAAPGRRAEYRAFRALPTRWKDNDAYGHMNNAEYLSIFDTALSLWQLDNGIALLGPQALRFLVVESGVRYHSEAGFPDVMHCGLRLPHMGRSSLRIELGLFRNDLDTACAEAFFVQVLTDEHSQPIPLPDPLRTIFAEIST